MTLAVVEKTLPMATITGRTDRQTDRVRRNMRPPPREEGRIIMYIYNNDAAEVMDLLFITLLPVTAMPCYGDTSTPTRGESGEILHDIL